MRGTILLGLMLAAAPAQTGVVQGTVICEGTSEPVSGVQITVGGGVATGSEPPPEANEPPYKPEYLSKVKALVEKYDYGNTSALDPQHDCKPLGIPRGATGIMQIVQTSKVTAIL